MDVWYAHEQEEPSVTSEGFDFKDDVEFFLDVLRICGVKNGNFTLFSFFFFLKY